MANTNFWYDDNQNPIFFVVLLNFKIENFSIKNCALVNVPFGLWTLKIIVFLLSNTLYVEGWRALGREKKIPSFYMWCYYHCEWQIHIPNFNDSLAYFAFSLFGSKRMLYSIFLHKFHFVSHLPSICLKLSFAIVNSSAFDVHCVYCVLCTLHNAHLKNTSKFDRTDIIECIQHSLSHWKYGNVRMFEYSMRKMFFVLGH